MVKHHSVKRSPAGGRGMLRLSLFLFLLFFVNVVMGKCNVAFQWTLPHLGSLAEFLLLGVASTLLIWAALQREAAENKYIKQNAKEVRDERSEKKEK